MHERTPPRQMFPDSRFVLGLFSPILGAFFGFCVYFTEAWQPPNLASQLGKFAVEDILFTLMILCGVGFIAAMVGPERVQPLFYRVGGKAAKSVLALTLGTLVYIIYSCVL